MTSIHDASTRPRIRRAAPIARSVFSALILLAALVIQPHGSSSVAGQEQRPGPQRQEPNRGGDIDLASMDPDVARQRLKVADGYEVSLFASEREFPELAKAVAAKFDARGRLWVATTPTYPHQTPGVAPNDKLVILDDTNRDGRADKLTVFADHLYLPIGFELGDGGVYLNQQPNLMFMRDTNGDDKADERRIILHGFGTEDSHHAIHAFTWSPGGTLHFQEGTFLHSQVETPYGPVRVDYGAVWEYEPRSEKLRVFASYPYANPWGHAIDRWGQDFISDASNGNNHFGTAYSGHVDYPRQQKRIKEWTTGVKMRPTCDVAFVSSRQFPDEAQGNFLVTNVIGFQGIKQYRVSDDGSGFLGTEVEPLIQSSDPNFRPVDLEFGPDGALYVVDWINPLIGHMQYSMRDPQRDRGHGRIWRITAKGRPLLEPPAIAGQPIERLLEQLTAYEDATRYRARRALREQPTPAVVAALGRWIDKLDATAADHEHHLLEALWVYRHHDVVPPDLLVRLLQAKDYRARAAAVRVLQHWLDRVPDSLTMLRAAVNDPAPRVRLEAVRALSFVPTKEAAEAALEALKHPTDYYIEYTLDSTMTTLEKAWKPALMTDTRLDSRDPRALGYLLGRVTPTELAALPPARVVYRALLARPDIAPPAREAALVGLSRLNARPGAPGVLQELVESIAWIDGTPGSSLITRDLVRLLIGSDVGTLSAQASALERLALQGKNPDVRQGAFVALLRAGRDGGAGGTSSASSTNSTSGTGSTSGAGAIGGTGGTRSTAGSDVSRVWRLASASPRSRIDLLNGVALIEDTALTSALYSSIDALLAGGDVSASNASALRQAPVMGRYVRVLLPGRERLTLAEVEVLSGGKNVALAGAASQSSTVSGYMGSGPARYATDGRTEGDAQGSGLSITSQERDPWWEVDLGAEMPIDAVTIWSPMRTVGGQADDDYRAVERPPDPNTPRPAPRPVALHVSVLNGSRQPTLSADGLVLPTPRLIVPLGGDFTAPVQQGAITALSYVPGHDPEIFSRIAGFLRPPSTRLAALDALRRRPAATWPSAAIAPLADTLAAAARETPPADRTDPSFVQTVAFARDVARQLPAAEQQRLTGVLDALVVKTITIEAVASQMKFDTASFTVAPGQEVEIVFVNRDEMPHNLLFTTPGKMEAVSLKAEAMASQPDAFSKHFIPESPDVLWSTPLVSPRETARLRFTAPQKADRYPFVCTFPGHWRTMNGVMQVANTPPATAAAAPSSPRSSGNGKASGVLLSSTASASASFAQPRKARPPHVVFVTGDDEYRSEITMPMIGKILEAELGFKVSVAMAQPRPQSKDNIVGLDALRTADLMVIFTRYRALPEAQLQYILDYVQTGKPIIGLRTSTHAFQYPAGHPRESLNDGFGLDVLGQKWITHHGHLSTTDVSIHAGGETHPILRGVTPFHASSWLYHSTPIHGDGATVLLDGTAIDSNKPAARLVEFPLTQPVAWARSSAQGARVFYTSLGHPKDFEQASMRRLLVNAILWTLGRDVPAAGGPATPKTPYTAPEVFDLSLAK